MNELAPQQLTSPATIDALRALVATLAPARAYTNKDAETILDLWLSSRNENTRRSYLSSMLSVQKHFGFASIEETVINIISQDQGKLNLLFLKFRDANYESRSSAWINQRLSAVRGMLRIARMTGISSIVLEVPAVKTEPVKSAEGCSLTDVSDALRKLYKQGNRSDYRTAALITIYMGIGLRVNEALSLDFPEHVVMENGEIKALLIRGKARKQRDAISLPELPRRALSLWMQRRGNAPGPLIPAIRDWGNQIGLRRWNRHMAFEVLRALGLRRNHAVRHCFITTANDAGIPLTTIVRMARHSSPNTTMKYIDKPQVAAAAGMAMLDEFLRTGKKPKSKPVKVPRFPAIEDLLPEHLRGGNLPASSTLQAGALRTCIELLEAGEKLTTADVQKRFKVPLANLKDKARRFYTNNPRIGEVLTMLDAIQIGSFIK